MDFAGEDFEIALRTLFRRCVQCPNDTAPSCPTCPSGQMCAQTPNNCLQCASTSCVPQTVDPTNTTSNKSSGPNVGAIAGGVVGGVAFIAILTFIVWKCLKGRKQQYEEGSWQQVDVPVEKSDPNDFTTRRDARSSTHTVGSVTSSILTRASNIIQIAYIPGVTNRSGPGSPDLLVPPVPPIPIATSPSTALSSPYSAEDQHFFVPGELRDSTYSGLTDGRSSYARTSITPSLARSSVATTIYRNNAIVSPLPAQTIVRGKAAVVSVKSNGTNSPAETPGNETPPVPQIDQKHMIAPIRIQMPRMASSSSLSPQGSVRSVATVGKPLALNITKKGKAGSAKSTSQNSTTTSDSQSSDSSTMRPLTEVSLAETEDSLPHSRARRPEARSTDIESESESDDDDHSRARRSLLRSSSNPRDSDITVIQDTPIMLQSPFTDSSSAPGSPEVPQRHISKSSTAVGPSGLATVMEESSRDSRASRRERSPFSDDNAVGGS
ncbi:hypothetical protein AOQ84DRAFT_196871 [Glonium stellatum]|uniref:Membrane anchor Opy2 N-terminal domain-containing protein n=1 Tax=Glonium stellatum TaxID=574774 RepID=A0A8E2F620_9PEZI|nr:hypothetical protein AOQ84DRAFT_196871 [Glonium stellatum]